MILLRLYYEFFKIGLFSVGGGLATLPFLYELGTRTGWFSASDVADMLAIAESTPGAIGVNMATYTGFRCAGIPGEFISTFGIISPSILIIILVAMALERFRKSRVVDGAFYGLRAASTALIASAGITVCKITFVNIPLFQSSSALSDLFQWKYIVLGIVMMIMTNCFETTKKFHPVFYIVFAAAVGIIV